MIFTSFSPASLSKKSGERRPRHSAGACNAPCDHRFFFFMSVRGCKRKTTKISTGGKKFMSHSYRAQTELIKWKPPSMRPPAWLKPLIFYLELLIPLMNIREHVEERQSLQLHVAMVVAWSLPFLGSMLSCFFEGTHKQPCLHSLKIISHLLRILLGLLQKQ